MEKHDLDTRESIDNTEDLAQRMETFLGAELLPFLIALRRFLVAPQRLIKPGESRIFDPSEIDKFTIDYEGKSHTQFIAFFGIEPCHPDIFFQVVGRLRHSWLNQNRLKNYFEAFLPYLDEIEAKETALSCVAKKFKKQISEFVHEGTTRTESSSSSPDETVLDVESHISRFRDCLSGHAISPEDGLETLLYYALKFANREGTLLDQFGETWQKSFLELSQAILRKLGCAAPERIIEMFRNYRIAFLGFPDEDLQFFETLWRKYPELLGRRNDLHDVRAVLAPSSTDRINRWDSRTQSITMWGSGYISSELARLERGSENILTQKEALGDRERTYVFLHEVAHAVDDYLLCLDHEDPTHLGRQWNAISWKQTKVGDERHWKPERAPFRRPDHEFDDLGACESETRIRSGPADQIAWEHGFVSFYAATNPAEDFAESLATYLIGNADFLKDISLQKYVFLKALLHNQT